MRDLEARNKLNCHGNAAPWTDFSQDTARLGADVRAAPAPAARWQGQAGQAGSGAPCTQWGRAPRHGSARLSGTSRKSWLSKEAWRSRRGSGAGRAARSGDSAFTSFHSTHRVVSTATAGRTGAASAPPSLAGWRLRVGSLGQASLAPHETGHNSWQGSFLPSPRGAAVRVTHARAAGAPVSAVTRGTRLAPAPGARPGLAEVLGANPSGGHSSGCAHPMGVGWGWGASGGTQCQQRDMAGCPRIGPR